MGSFPDAFGHALHDYLQSMEEGIFFIIERDDGLLDVLGSQSYFAEYEEWPAHHQGAMSYVRGRVLDIGCGAGRHALHLQSQGFDVLGIDESPLAIEVCKTRGLQKARVLSITQASRKLGTFDTILLMGNNFGLLGSLKRAGWLLRRFHSLTSARGRIIAETLDPYPTQDPMHLEYQQHNRERGRAGGQVRIRVRYRKYVNPWFDYWFAPKDEMQRLLKGTGWTVQRFLDSDDLRYVAIIEKEMV
jgi:SAM-dependent methyltransferase